MAVSKTMWTQGIYERRRLGANFKKLGILAPGSTLASVDSLVIRDSAGDDVSADFGTASLAVGDYVDANGNVLAADVVALFFAGKGATSTLDVGKYTVELWVTDSASQRLQARVTINGESEVPEIEIVA